jgi:putative peptidoglycan lipid II flippase
MLFFVLSRAAGLVREVVIAAQFGASAALDAYLAAFRAPDLFFQLVAGGALGSAFVPTFATYWSREDRTGAWLLFSRVLNGITLILLVVTSVVAGWALPLVQWVIAPGFSPEQQHITAQLMRWMLVSTVIFGASGLVMGALNATQSFLWSAAAPVFYNLAIILGAWFLSPWLGVYGLVVGVVAGAGTHLFVQLPGLWRIQARYWPSFTWRDPGVREVLRLMAPRALGILFVQLHFLVNVILASRLPAGSLSALNYAWLLMLLPQGIFAQSMATAVFPTLAAQAAGDQLTAMYYTLSRSFRAVLFLALPSAAGLIILREPLVIALLQRGEFGAQSAQMVAHALFFYALGLTAHALVEIAVRAFYALHDTLTPVIVGVIAMLINLGLSIGWVNWLGYGGLALANSTATTLEMLGLLWLLQRRLGGLDERGLTGAVVRQLCAALLMAGVLWGWLRWMGSGSSMDARLQAWWLITGGTLIGGGIYTVASLVLGSQELAPIARLFGRFFSSRKR